jgi:hypothetical protein
VASPHPLLRRFGGDTLIDRFNTREYFAYRDGAGNGHRRSTPKARTKDLVRQMLDQAAVRPAAVPKSREQIEAEVRDLLNPARFRTARTQHDVRLDGVRRNWESRGIPWDLEAAEQMIPGDRGRAIDHVRGAGVTPSSAALGLEHTPSPPCWGWGWPTR